MTRYRNTQTGKVVEWDDRKGKLTSFWVADTVAEEVYEAPELNLVVEIPEAAVDVLPPNTFVDYSELVRNADKALGVAFVDHKAYKYNTEIFRWKRNRKLDAATAAYTETAANNVDTADEEDWS